MRSHSLTLAIALLVSTVASARPKVIAVFDKSGNREPATDALDGIRLARDILAESGLDLELVEKNSGPDAVGTREAMLAAVSESPTLILAEIDSSKAVVAAEIAEAAARVMITPYATSPRVTEGRSFVFRSCFADDFQGRKLADYALSKLGKKTAIVVSDAGQIYSKTLADAFSARFTELGGTVERRLDTLFATVDPAAVLPEIAAAKADLVFLPVYEGTASRILQKVATEPGLQSKTFMGGDGWGASGPFRDLVFPKGSTINAFWVSHYSGNLESESIKLTAAEYLKRTGRKFNASVAAGFDSMMIAGETIRQAGSKASQQELAKTLRGLSWQGTTGALDFAGKQDPSKSMYLRSIGKDGMLILEEVRP